MGWRHRDNVLAPWSTVSIGLVEIARQERPNRGNANPHMVDHHSIATFISK